MSAKVTVARATTGWGGEKRARSAWLTKARGDEETIVACVDVFAGQGIRPGRPRGQSHGQIKQGGLGAGHTQLNRFRARRSRETGAGSCLRTMSTEQGAPFAIRFRCYQPLVVKWPRSLSLRASRARSECSFA